jgi:hypothetical protein
LNEQHRRQAQAWLLVADDELTGMTLDPTDLVEDGWQLKCLIEYRL